MTLHLLNPDEPVLVIPDIHNQIEQLQAILEEFKDIRQKVSLGDWFDSFDEGPFSARNTAEAYKEFSSNPDNRILFGNHDIQYAFPFIRGLKCSGFAPEKQTSIDAVLTKEIWNNTLLHVRVGNFLLTHAGVHPRYADSITGLSDPQYMIDYEAAVFSALNGGQIHPLVMAGRSRGGTMPFGGLTWLDFREFEPVPNVNQIVGHTHSRYGEVRQKVHEDGSSINYCIDTGLKHVAVIENQKVTVHTLASIL